jgi:ArsR family transcriptional regulator, arsenate/arsenite/antimonite-responsive transcriptional repressor
MQRLDIKMTDIIKVIKALSDESRLRIMNLLLMANIELCVCELEEILDIPQYNISKHAKELKNAKLIKERKEGRFVFYSLIKNEDEFLKKTSELIQSIPEEYFNADNEFLSQKISELLKSEVNEKRCRT